MKKHLFKSTFKSSALVFTLLVIGMVATLSLFVSRGVVREARIAATRDSSLAAYYAAEAGIEDGLARVAADKNIEVPTCLFGKVHQGAGGPTAPCDTTPADAGIFNTNLTLGTLDAAIPDRVRMARSGSNSDQTGLKTNAPLAVGGDGDLNQVIDPANTAIPQPNTDPRGYYYDLKITSRATSFGKVDQSGAPADPTGVATAKIAKDNSKQFIVDTSGSNQPTRMNFWWTCSRSNGSCQPGDYLQITLVRTSVVNPGTDTTDDVVFDKFQSGPGNHFVSLVSATDPVSRVIVKALGVDAFVSINFVDVNGNIMTFKSDKAKVQSVGYYGGVKRKLEADIDRSSGNLLGLFDYAVYAGSSFLQPQ